MSRHILDLCWLPFFYHKDAYRIKFSRFYLSWGVRYQHLCDFSHFEKCDNYVITSSNVCKFSKTRTCPSQAKEIPTCQKLALAVFQFLQSILYI